MCFCDISEFFLEKKQTTSPVLDNYIYIHIIYIYIAESKKIETALQDGVDDVFPINSRLQTIALGGAIDESLNQDLSPNIYIYDILCISSHKWAIWSVPRPCKYSKQMVKLCKHTKITV